MTFPNDTEIGYSMGASLPIQNTLTFSNCQNGGEMLKIAPDGFYVRGEKISQDADEARKVYDTFILWLRTTGLMP